MKSFITTLQKIYGHKGAYRLSEITEAYNVFVKSQVSDVSFKSDLKEDKYYTINCPIHKWHDKLVRSTMKKNPSGLVPIYFGASIDWIHYSFLI